MIKLGRAKASVDGGAGKATSHIDPSHLHYIDRKGRVRRRSGPMHVLGNLLIIVGVLMLIGIGGWYGYREWDNHQFVETTSKKFGDHAFEPAANLTPVPTIELPRPLPVLANTGLGTGVQSLPVQVDTSPPARLVIPSVKIDTKVVPVSWRMLPAPGGATKSEWQVADYAVGHHQGSANPGQPGNVVMSGHVDYKGQVFKDLNRVNKGDEVTVFTEKGQYIYVVTDLKIVKEEGVSAEQKRLNAMYMNPTPDQTLTMITCWPYGVDDHRLIVIAKPYQSSLSAGSEFVIR